MKLLGYGRIRFPKFIEVLVGPVSRSISERFQLFVNPVSSEPLYHFVHPLPAHSNLDRVILRERHSRINPQIRQALIQPTGAGHFARPVTAVSHDPAIMWSPTRSPRVLECFSGLRPTLV